MEKDYNNLKNEYEELKQKYNELQKKNTKLEDQLKKYTAPVRKKIYYQNHKEDIKKKVKEYRTENNYKSSVTAEKRKEYNKRAYEKRKEKQKNISSRCTNSIHSLKWKPLSYNSTPTTLI